MKTPAFARAVAMMALVAKAMALSLGQRQGALAEIGPYVSRGKGGKRPFRRVGTKANQRAALKRRNQGAQR